MAQVDNTVVALFATGNVLGALNKAGYVAVPVPAIIIFNPFRYLGSGGQIRWGQVLIDTGALFAGAGTGIGLRLSVEEYSKERKA